MHSVAMLFVADVEATSSWYQQFLGVQSGHGGPEFEMLLADGSVILQLHHLGDHDHDVNMDGEVGAGVQVVIYVDDAEASFARAKDMDVSIVAELHFNEVANMHEFTVRDPNGYSLMICESHWD